MHRPWLGFICLLAACDPNMPMGDAGPGADASAPDGGADGTIVSVELDSSDEGLPAGWSLRRLRLRVDEIRATNDRGGDMEPVWAPGESVELGEVAMDLDGVPATYGGLSLRGDGGEEPTLEIELATSGDERIEVVSNAGYDLGLRCGDGPVRLEAASTLSLRARLDVAAIADALDDGDLPAPNDGVVTVDEEEAPDVLADVERAFDEGWSLECQLLDAEH